MDMHVAAPLTRQVPVAGHDHDTGPRWEVFLVIT